MNDRVLFQIMDVLRSSGQITEVFILSLQMLAWAKLSAAGHLPEDLYLQHIRGNVSSAEDLREIWQKLSKLPQLDENAQAFQGDVPKLGSGTLSTSLEIAANLAEEGFLKRFDIRDSGFLLSAMQERGGVLPDEVADLMIGLGVIKPDDTLYCPFDYLCQLASRGSSLKAQVFIEIPGSSPFPWLSNLLRNQSIQVRTSDPIRHPNYVSGGKLEQFNVSVAFPPMGTRYDAELSEKDLYGRFPEKTNSGTLFAVRHILAQTQKRAVIAVPSSLLFSIGADRAFREDVLEKQLIELVLAMPPALLLGSAIPFSIIVFNKHGNGGEVRFVDGANPLFFKRDGKGRSKLTDVEGLLDLCQTSSKHEALAIVPVSDVRANEAQLQVSRYVLPDNQRKLQARLETDRSCALRVLSDLVTFLRPAPTISSDEGIEAFEIGSADLPDFGYVGAAQRQVTLAAGTLSKATRFFLQPHDIVLVTKGSVGKVGIIPEGIPNPGAGGWVAGQSALVLRVNKDSQIDPRALYLYLRSEIGQALLKGIVSGATIPLIQLRELEKLLVMVPTKQDQDAIIRTFQEEVRIKAQIDELREQQAALAARHWSLETTRGL
jgi:type I restriction enzyme M protein